ncbi:hypothetical protein C2G38_2217219 [Gigaspora rosea]|uniref:TLD-domain-containing protein n=1 Tax=Gigaspora rosea TaxID=44941 RepID=A0A397UBB9_9GLOM|nr:hypothetical protein C2G38_2217219 [Gigaspora rosea]
MTTKFFDNLSFDLLVLLKKGKGRDVIVNVGKGTESKPFELHSGILYVRCPYFSNELDKLDYNEEHIKEINKPDISVDVFQVIIMYIYGGIISFENMDSNIIFESLMIANEFQLSELAKYIENYLIQHHEFWIHTNFSKIYRATIENDSLGTLQKYCVKVAAENPDLIFDSDDFTTLPEGAFVSILERDDLQMSEAKIWDLVIKWGIAQNPSLPPNQNQWSDLDFLILKTTLKNCLPLIRFFQFTGEEVLDKLRPYQKILDPNLWTDIMTRFMAPNKSISSVVLPPRKLIYKSQVNDELNFTMLPSPIQNHSPSPIQNHSPSPIQNQSLQRFELNSNIISTKHATEIVSWIDRTEYRSDEVIPYRFNLLTRGSRDGFNGKSFHRMCKGKDYTLMVLKVNGSGEILGGFNPLRIPTEKERTWLSTHDSFIFSLKNNDRSILSRVARSERAIWNNSVEFYGPHFSNEDLVMLGDFQTEKRCFSRFRHYEKAIRNTNAKFSVDEYEVFQLQHLITTEIPGA